MGLDVPAWPSRPGPPPTRGRPGAVAEGVYSGGTLADEAMLIAAAGARRHPLEHPAEARARPRRPTSVAAEGHVVIDFGDDALTVGRAHPMIDPTLRLRGDRGEAARRAGPAVLLLDVVLGYGADPDPPPRWSRRSDRRRDGRRSAGRRRRAGRHRGRPAGLVRQADALRRGRRRRASRPTPPPRALRPRPASRDHRGVSAEWTARRAAGRRRRRRRRLLRRAARAGRRRHDVDWRPPGFGTAEDLAALALRIRAAAAANRTAVERVLAAGSGWSTSGRPGRCSAWRPGMLLHAGPPLDLGPRLGPAARRAASARCCSRGWRRPPTRPPRALAAGARSRSTRATTTARSGPMAGVTQPVDVDVVARGPGARRPGVLLLNEGLGKVLRYGAYGPRCIERLRWMPDVLGPVLSQAVRWRGDASGGVDVKAILAQMLQMGDEGHNRNRAGSLMALRELLPVDRRRSTRRRPTSPRAAVHRRQRALLPQPRHADGEARDGRRPRRARLDDGHRDGPQRHRVRHPDRRHRRPLVHRPGEHPGRAVPRRLRPGRRQPRHRRLRDHGDLRRRRLLDGGGARRSCGSSAAPCRDALATTERMYQLTLAENPAMAIPIMGFRGLADRASTSSRSPAPAGCRRSTPAWPGGWPAPARSAPGWCSRPSRCFEKALPRSPSGPRRWREARRGTRQPARPTSPRCRRRTRHVRPVATAPAPTRPASTGASQP